MHIDGSFLDDCPAPKSFDVAERVHTHMFPCRKGVEMSLLKLCVCAVIEAIYEALTILLLDLESA